MTATFSVEYGKRLCRDAASMEVTSNLQSAQLLYTRALCLFTLVLDTPLQEVRVGMVFVLLLWLVI